MTKEQLYTYLKLSQSFKNPRIDKAFQTIDRKNFVTEGYKDVAYEDRALPIGLGATISQPSVVLFMLNCLDPKVGDKILDVGSGSGWTTALLASIVGEKGKIYAVELIPGLVVFSKNNLGKYNFQNVEISLAGEKLGLPDQAPFDRILVSAAANELPQDLIEQLKISGPPRVDSPDVLKTRVDAGRMLIPIKNSIWQIDRITDTKNEIHKFEGFAFVPLR